VSDTHVLEFVAKIDILQRSENQVRKSRFNRAERPKTLWMNDGIRCSLPELCEWRHFPDFDPKEIREGVFSVFGSANWFKKTA
jgi:hypothetical protein